MCAARPMSATSTPRPRSSDDPAQGMGNGRLSHE